jgi:hypothetical protein
MSDVNATRRASLVAAVLLAASFWAAVGAAVAAPAASVTPIVTLTRHGGLCITGSECRSTWRIDDATIAGDRYVPRRLKATERAALLRAIAAIAAKYLRAHPFKGTCPVAYDGQESIYRFRGFARPLPSCTYDLRGVEAVRVAERLFRTLKPKRP